MLDINSFENYEDMDALSIAFIGTPKKNLETDIYSVRIKDPIKFKLPKSRLLEIKEGTNGIRKAKYELKDQILIQFLDNFDAKMINLSNKYSLKWFGRDIPQIELINYYKNIYDIENNVRSLYLTLDNDEDYEELLNYNIEDDQNIIICISEMHIYKDAMKLNINLESFVYGDQVDSVDILKDIVSSNTPLCETHIVTLDRSVCETNIVNSDNWENDHNIVYTESSDEESDLGAGEDSIEFDINNKDEMLDLIRTKERIRKTLISNTTRINNAKEDLVAKTIGIDKELDMFRNQLENM
tara:strand:- start:250 stop:1143 length:894 start_codon:yes stop_codon:yes gene_type:complete